MQAEESSTEVDEATWVQDRTGCEQEDEARACKQEDEQEDEARACKQEDEQEDETRACKQEDEQADEERAPARLHPTPYTLHPTPSRCSLQIALLPASLARELFGSSSPSPRLTLLFSLLVSAVGRRACCRREHCGRACCRREHCGRACCRREHCGRACCASPPTYFRPRGLGCRLSSVGCRG
jgi:hypothetical protein